MKRPDVFSFLWQFNPGGKAAFGLRLEPLSGTDEQVPSQASRRAGHFTELLSHFRWCRGLSYAAAPLAVAGVLATRALYPDVDLNTPMGYLLMSVGPSAAAALYGAVWRTNKSLVEFRNHEDAQKQVEKLPAGPLASVAVRAGAAATTPTLTHR
jgi:hypothetical protein